MATIRRALPFSTATLGCVVLIAALSYLLYRLLGIGRRPAVLPPGPPTQAIWGNLRQCDSFFPHHQYTEWASKYGPVYTMMQGGQPQVIVSGLAEAREIFVKQGARTQSRPPSRFKLLMRGGYFPSVMNGLKWQHARRMWHAVLNSSASSKYLPYQELESEQLLLDMLNKPHCWYDHLERYTNSVGMTMVNGYRITSSDDPIVKETIEDLYELSRVGVRGNVLDLWPVLWKLPIYLLPICREARELAEKHKRFIWRNYTAVKESVKQGTTLPSFNRTIQERLQSGWRGVSEIEGAEIGQHLLSGATDTTVSVLTTFVAAICLFPGVQRKAQEGSERLPQYEDTASLPYIQQLILEAQRWITSVPLCLPRVANGTVRWGNYEISEGTGLIINAHAIHSDPGMYPEPHIFQPERWEGKLDATRPDNQLLFTFGAGRRHCPGQHLAERSLFMVVSRWLWALDTSQAKDKDGNDIPINTKDLRPGVINRLKPFQADIKPRSPERATLIRQVWRENCEYLLDQKHQWKLNPDINYKRVK
ncbi:conserved hypothetical protein [Uncinocarpus reesii 1704]|uniref:Cytochrome P450 n=1 Tax=Uncinocarpus reesii (strain UAMH 1704) TaxID=336963 RepID=C4JNM6_UNCRE|nr:uncharacterized protein UREG_03024 [Uncinocarpus reesii 1704]EEP78179.1 conserved hypothetical protein [Uncinocarpus reesii 1704]